MNFLFRRYPRFFITLLIRLEIFYVGSVESEEELQDIVKMLHAEQQRLLKKLSTQQRN